MLCSLSVKLFQLVSLMCVCLSLIPPRLWLMAMGGVALDLWALPLMSLSYGCQRLFEPLLPVYEKGINCIHLRNHRCLPGRLVSQLCIVLPGGGATPVTGPRPGLLHTACPRTGSHSPGAP